ncbi:hypothetical protein BZG36_03635 [Bifiguratus adelaidae]|uniref:Low temperature requirement protein A n=1 Tax=Bifiguratus adelaidae TaxID=1938954 RepID=A0A261Y066_9FUNG|nr:hypothetical protein BZG36_03635 [Bifiguratus adelaidae]
MRRSGNGHGIALERVRSGQLVTEERFSYYALPGIDESRLFKRPIALQFHYDGHLYRVDGERSGGIFELFLDLLYVGIVANFARNVTEFPDGIHILKYIIIFLHAYQIWHDLRELFNQYYTDDLGQRALVLAVMAAMVAFANNAVYIGEEMDGEPALITALVAYIIAHCLCVAVFLIYSVFVPEHAIQIRAVAFTHIFTVGIRVAIPFVSWGGRIAICWVAIACERLSWLYFYSPWFKRHAKLTFSTAVNISHEVDRMTALFIIVLGAFLSAIVVGSPAGIGATSGLARAILILVCAFCLNWMYSRGDGAYHFTHAIRRRVWSAFLWFFIHEPLSASLILAGDISSSLTLHEDPKIEHKWIFAASLCIGLLCMWVLALLNECHDQLVWRKPVRMAVRPLVAVIIVFLPLADLNATNFLGVCAGLLVFTLVWETYGALDYETERQRSNSCPAPPPEERDASINGVREVVGEKDENVPPDAAPACVTMA